MYGEAVFKKKGCQKKSGEGCYPTLRHSYDLISLAFFGLGHIRDKKTLAALLEGAVRTLLESALC
ncbi:hypothetical protein [Arsenophonus nasoniae]|uniref:hypothetical protein n=1 Tax=Arsenophonus nasoniae TaxID=638 RepID=UPI001FEA417C|nr:hypothetical protein [Arsenophonus nasoniae]